MFVRIHSAKKYGNTGSSKGIIEYLEKENLDSELSEVELFFNHSNEEFSAKTVISKIDSNCAKLGRDDARFYMVSINPSQDEMKHIAQSISGRRVNSIKDLSLHEKRRFERALKDYTCGVMEKYAQGFNKNLTANDLLYFGKVEHERKYSRFDDDVLLGRRKENDLKEGFQSHVHVVVSRKDITNRKKLSPLANHKNSKNKLNGKEYQIGFHRKQFVQNCEKEFDRLFSYSRRVEQSFKYRYGVKNAAANVARTLGRQVFNKVPGYRLLQTSKEDPLKMLEKAFWKSEGSKQVMQAMNAISSPYGLTTEAAKKLSAYAKSATTLKI